MIRSTTILTAADVDRLSQLYLFREVPRAALESLALSATTVRFAEGDTVFQQGTPADVALLLAEGRLTVHVLGPQGADRVLGELRPGEVVGEQALLMSGASRSATVRAAEPCAGLLLSRELLERGQQNPAVVAIEQHLIASLVRRIRKTNQTIQGVWKAEEVPAPQPRSLGERLRALFGA